MTLQHRLLLGFGGLWLIFLVATALSIAGLNYYGHSLENIFHDNYDSVVYCDRMKQSLDELNLAAESTVWSHSPPPDITLRNARDRFNANAILEKNNVTLPHEPELSAGIFEQGHDYQDQLERFLAAPEGQRLGIYQQDLLPRYLKARATAQTISDLNLDAMRQTDLQIRRNLHEVGTTLVVLVLLGATLAIASVFVLARAILNPLKALTTSVRQIEGGDLDLKVPIRSRDEIGQLAAAFNSMAATLREYRRSDHARLMRTQQTTQLAIDSLPDAVAVFGPTGLVEISNREARQHFGLEQGRSLQDLPLEWLRQLYSSARETGAAVEPRGYRSAVQIFDRGEERFLLPRAVPMLDDQKGVIGVVVTLVDVTRLRHADELKSDLVSTVSHELKTPLTSTRMAVHMLAQQTVGPLNPKQLRLVTAAKDDTDRLHKIIENLLNMSRIESGGQTLRLMPMDPRAIVEQALTPAKGDFEKKDIAVSVHMPAMVPWVQGDPTCVGYILTNLLSNALKFTPPSGRVEISVAMEADVVAFTVGDSGPGIAPEHLPRLFEKFFRVPATDGPPGAGLGLSIAKEIVEAHGGTISVATSPGCGAQFTFKLKVAS
jgi:two-component system, NtrC family, sensor histidine kinase KinB